MKLCSLAGCQISTLLFIEIAPFAMEGEIGVADVFLLCFALI
jgi:hypothetical protein